MPVIARDNYPELNKILWDIKADKIQPKDAFEIYERRWGYVEQQNLTQPERKLIAKLARLFGNGIFAPLNV
ncbi:hypothetical protein [Rheinheimera texasensis]|uniref:hypothetical protein n=1 Tax=Rheinheimera texasensis TaxID=306205 RepID=UPI0032B14CB7